MVNSSCDHFKLLTNSSNHTRYRNWCQVFISLLSLLQIAGKSIRRKVMVPMKIQMIVFYTRFDRRTVLNRLLVLDHIRNHWIPIYAWNIFHLILLQWMIYIIVNNRGRFLNWDAYRRKIIWLERLYERNNRKSPYGCGKTSNFQKIVVFLQSDFAFANRCHILAY